REEVRRPVLAEQIAPADLKRRPRREFEPLLGTAIVREADGTQPHFTAGAAANRRRRRLLDGHEQIARRLAAVAQFGDARAPEETERVERPLALVHGGTTER